MEEKQLPSFPPISDELIEALDSRFPDAVPRIMPHPVTGARGPSQGIDLEAIGKSILRTIGHREVIEMLMMQQEKQRSK